MIVAKWTLVPILTNREADDAFAGRLREGASRATLLFVVDQEQEKNVSVAGTKIKQAEETMSELKKKLGKGVLVKELVEWGKWELKIRNIAMLEKCDEVLMIDCPKARELAPALRNEGVNANIARP